jgi:hypothetical protein
VTSSSQLGSARSRYPAIAACRGTDTLAPQDAAIGVQRPRVQVLTSHESLALADGPGLGRRPAVRAEGNANALSKEQEHGKYVQPSHHGI